MFEQSKKAAFTFFFHIKISMTKKEREKHGGYKMNLGEQTYFRFTVPWNKLNSDIKYLNIASLHPPVYI